MGRSARNVVVGQRVDEAKVYRARELRRRMTEEEMILWKALRGNRVHGLHFRRQQIIDGFIVDFYCHSCALVVEVDGGIHQQQAEYDAERDRILAARGLRILRIQNEDVRRDLSEVLARIVAGADLTPPAPLPDAGRGESSRGGGDGEVKAPLSAPERGRG